MIRILAKSLSGSEHILNGRVENKQSVLYKSEDEAKRHLKGIGWTELRFAITERVVDGKLEISWDDQSLTSHVEGSGEFQYLRGNKGLSKISKSQLG